MLKQTLTSLLILSFCACTANPPNPAEPIQASSNADVETFEEHDEDPELESENEPDELGGEENHETNEHTPPTPSSAENNAQVKLSRSENQDILSNGQIEFVLDYQGQLELEQGPEDWSPERRQPYVDAGKRWLSALVGLDAGVTHRLTMQIHVKKLDVPADGTAEIEESEEKGDYIYPVLGVLNIGNHTYNSDFSSAEFNANILHEMGHVFGLGELSEDFVSDEPQQGGNVFRAPNSKAVEMYQEIYGVTYDFVPMSDNGAHLYDSVKADDQKRNHPSGQALPPLTQEFMANGTAFGKVSFGIYDDIGYVVNYTVCDQYTP